MRYYKPAQESPYYCKETFERTGECPEGCYIMTNCEGKEVCSQKGGVPECGGHSYYGQQVECCEGLVRRCGALLPDGSCDNTSGVYVDFPRCLNCGNGKCEQFENRCNCPEDCK